MKLTEGRWWRRQGVKLVRGLTLHRHWGPALDFSALQVLDAMPIFAPNSGGSYRSKVPLALRAANESFPLLSEFASAVGHTLPEVMDLSVLAESGGAPQVELQGLFKRHGSDKGGFHNYHLLYGHLFPDREVPRKIFEIGLGTNYTDVVSNMGYHGSPGASLRAFRDYYPNATIFGADIDRRVLFSETRIQTFHIDQSDDATFDALPEEARTGLDLFIDDGLHAPDANLRSLRRACAMVRPGGAIVIEDIREAALPVWLVAGALLGQSWQPCIYRASRACMFVCRRPEA